MLRCASCDGFVPSGLDVCPNCARRGSLGRGFLALVGAGVAAVTLMACYGAPAHLRNIPAEAPAAAEGSDVTDAGTK